MFAILTNELWSEFFSLNSIHQESHQGKLKVSCPYYRLEFVEVALACRKFAKDAPHSNVAHHIQLWQDSAHYHSLGYLLSSLFSWFQQVANKAHKLCHEYHQEVEWLQYRHRCYFEHSCWPHAKNSCRRSYWSRVHTQSNHEQVL